MYKIRLIHNLGLSIFVIGLINIYNILKKGIIFNLPVNNNNEYNGIMKLDLNNIKIIIFITLILWIIINSVISNNNNPLENIIEKKEKRDSLEYQLLLGLGLLGLILMIVSKELIILYLGLELYSFTVYILILVKESLVIRKISIIYLILSSLASGILLYTFNNLYQKYGILDIENIKIIASIENIENNIIVYLLLIAFLFKLGTIPFSYWLIRVYADLDKRIFLYQLTIPKLIFFILLIKFLSITNFSSLSIIYILFFLSIFSLLLGSIGGLFQTKDNLLLAYSSILNFGFILLSLSLTLYFSLNHSEGVLGGNYLTIFSENLDNNRTLWVLYHFIIIYILNLVGIFSALFISNYSSIVLNLRSFFNYPFFFISFLLLIFSFIGIPPLSGFFSKFYLIFTFFTNSSNINISLFSLFFVLLSTLISSFFYLKFLFSSSTNTISSSSISSENAINFNNSKNVGLILSFSTIISVLYPFFLIYFLPFFQDLTNFLS